MCSLLLWDISPERSFLRGNALKTVGPPGNNLLSVSPCCQTAETIPKRGPPISASQSNKRTYSTQGGCLSASRHCCAESPFERSRHPPISDEYNHRDRMELIPWHSQYVTLFAASDLGIAFEGLDFRASEAAPRSKGLRAISRVLERMT